MNKLSRVLGGAAVVVAVVFAMLAAGVIPTEWIVGVSLMVLFGPFIVWSATLFCTPIERVETTTLGRAP